MTVPLEVGDARWYPGLWNPVGWCLDQVVGSTIGVGNCAWRNHHVPAWASSNPPVTGRDCASSLILAPCTKSSAGIAPAPCDCHGSLELPRERGEFAESLRL